MNIMIRTTIIMIAFLCISSLAAQKTALSSPVDYMVMSADFVQVLKENGNASDIVAQFALTTLADIKSQVDTEDKKLAFWINVYNGFIISILKEHPEYYLDRRAFFKEPYIQIAGEKLSFADIEHGILRRGQKGWGLGYISGWFPPKYQRNLRPSKRDYKIHFGLNCGAKSCPPVSIYTAEKVHEQLCTREKAYLSQETQYDKEKNRVTTSALLSWFRGDFGGKRGAKKLLFNQGLIPSEKVDLEFGGYDWTLDIDNFVD